MSLYNIRVTKPLVHCITNYVVANFTANGLYAIGASPVMADAVQEVKDMTSIANALLLNIGTLNERTVESMLLAGQTANEKNIPIVLDPVGVGATPFRKQSVDRILQAVNIQLLRCNGGELASIAGARWQSKGVDSGEGSMDIAAVAKQVAKRYNCIVAVTGERDYITDGLREDIIEGGHEDMTLVTGTGCLLSAICAGALAVEGDGYIHLKEVLHDYKEVAQRASAMKGIGHFQAEILNSLQVIARGESSCQLH